MGSLPGGKTDLPQISKHPAILSYALAVASVAAATAASLPLADIAVHSRSMFLFAAVMLSAWYGGFGPGILSSVLAVLSFDYFLDVHPGTIDLNLPAALRAGVFLAVALFTAYLTAQRRKALINVVASHAELEKALEEIKVLRGILPICMHCKQVRTDAGLWQQVEQYVSEHTEAQFSHGVCPECMKKLYPEVSEAMEKKNAATQSKS